MRFKQPMKLHEFVLAAFVLIWRSKCVFSYGVGTQIGSTRTVLHDIGVSSVQLSSSVLKGMRLLVGTKRGALLETFIGADSTSSNVKQLDDMHAQELKPIYSMINFELSLGSAWRNETSQIIACGGGDRFVTIWQSLSTLPQPYISARLGPHTGWVKDVVYDHENHKLFTIGCNFIEIWHKEIEVGTQDKKDCLEKKEGSITWVKGPQLKIESCPLNGSTLSSDLLCLCLDNPKEPKLLFSGGVDGRIHVWDTGRLDEDTNPIQAFSAHDGRVNKIVIATQAKVLFSIGHDGTLQCIDLSLGNRTFHNDLVRDSKTITCTDDESSRLLSLCIVQDGIDVSSVAVGTSNGSVHLMHIRRKEDKSIEIFSRKGEYVELQGRPSIHAVSASRHITNDIGRFSHHTIAIGHSKGLTLWDIKVN